MKHTFFLSFFLFFVASKGLAQIDSNFLVNIGQIEADFNQLLSQNPPNYKAVIKSCAANVESTKTLDPSKVDTSSALFHAYHYYRLKLVDVYIQQNNIEQPMRYLQEILNVSAKATGKDSYYYLAALDYLAKIYEFQKAYQNTEALFNEKLSIIDARIKRFSKPLDQDKLNKSYLSKKVLLNQYATLHQATGNRSKLVGALLYKAEVMKKLEQHESPEFVELLAYIGHSYGYIGDYPNARKYFEASIALLKFVEEKTKVGIVHERLMLLNYQGSFYVATGEDFLGLANFNTALIITDKYYGKESVQSAANLANLAKCTASLGDYAKADSLFDVSVKILELEKNHAYAQPYYIPTLKLQTSNYINHQKVRLDNGEDIPIEEIENEAIEQRIQQILTAVAHQHGEQHPNYSDALTLAAHYKLITQDFEGFLEVRKKQLKIDKATLGEHSLIYLSNLSLYARYQEKLGLMDESGKNVRDMAKFAMENLVNNISNAVETERWAFFDRVQGFFHHFYCYAVRNMEEFPELKDELLNLNLQFKSLISQTSIDLQQSVLESKNKDLLDAYNKWVEAKKYLSYAQSLPRQQQVGIWKPDSLRWKVRESERKMVGLSSNFQNVFEHRDVLDFKKLQAQLGPKEACISYLSIYYDDLDVEVIDRLPSHYYAILVLPNEEHPIIIKITDKKTLEAILKEEVSVNTQNYIADEIENESLYDLIWEPLESYLENTETIYLSSVGLLNRVSFGAILSKNSDERLVNEFNFHYINSLRALKSCKEKLNKKTTSKKVALVGAVDFDEHSDISNNNVDTTAEGDRASNAMKAFNYLPGTKNEIHTLGKFFTLAGWNVTSLEGKQANESNLRALTGEQAPSVLHIATHGFFLEKSLGDMTSIQGKLKGHPNMLMRSGLALSGANKSWTAKTGQKLGKDDGLLTASEVALLDLHKTDLVVLSACETGLGNVGEVETVFGLQSSFKLAGAKQLIISLWKVPDKQTNELMQLFYQHYLKGHSVHDSFQFAQRSMSKKYPNPYYWAAFLLLE